MKKLVLILMVVILSNVAYNQTYIVNSMKGGEYNSYSEFWYYEDIPDFYIIIRDTLILFQSIDPLEPAHGLVVSEIEKVVKGDTLMTIYKVTDDYVRDLARQYEEMFEEYGIDTRTYIIVRKIVNKTEIIYSPLKKRNFLYEVEEMEIIEEPYER